MRTCLHCHGSLCTQTSEQRQFEFTRSVWKSLFLRWLFSIHVELFLSTFRCFSYVSNNHFDTVLVTSWGSSDSRSWWGWGVKRFELTRKRSPKTQLNFQTFYVCLFSFAHNFDEGRVEMSIRHSYFVGVWQQTKGNIIDLSLQTLFLVLST